MTGDVTCAGSVAPDDRDAVAGRMATVERLRRLLVVDAGGEHCAVSGRRRGRRLRHLVAVEQEVVQAEPA